MSTDTNPIPSVEAIEEVASQFKKGYKTSEFWVSAVSALVPLGAWIAKLFGWDVNAEDLATAMIGLVPGAAYIFSRGWVKKQRNVTVASALGSGVELLKNPDFIQAIVRAIDAHDRDALEGDIIDIEDPATGEDDNVDTSVPPPPV